MGPEIDIFFTRLAVHDARLAKHASEEEEKSRAMRNSYRFLISSGPLLMEEAVRAVSDRMSSYPRPRRLAYVGPVSSLDNPVKPIEYCVSLDQLEGRLILSLCFEAANPDDRSNPYPGQMSWKISGADRIEARGRVDSTEVCDPRLFRVFFLKKLCSLVGVDES